MRIFQNGFSRAVAVTACSLGLVIPSGAQDAEANVKVGDAEGKAKIDLPDRPERDADRATTDKADRAADSVEHRTTHVGKINKASGIIGMNVVNEQNEKLGSINDVVVDLETGRIGYAVLSVGGVLGIGDKLYALPPSAFSAGPTEDTLVVKMDKARLEATPGLAKDSWPAVNNPQFSGLWETDRDALGATASGEVRSSSSERPENERQDRSIDRSQNRDRDAASSRPGSKADQIASGSSFRGRIVAIDPEKRTMRVEGESGTREFTFTDRPTLNVGLSNRNPQLVDFKVGYPVNVGYHEENGSYVAHSVMRTDPTVTR